jgi:hypothetical protein
LSECPFLRRGHNRSAVGTTAISASGRPPPLVPPALTSLVACTGGLRHAIFRPGGAHWRLRSPPSLGGGPAPRRACAPYPSIQSTITQRPCQSRLRPPRLYPQGRRGLGQCHARPRPCGYKILQREHLTGLRLRCASRSPLFEIALNGRWPSAGSRDCRQARPGRQPAHHQPPATVSSRLASRSNAAPPRRA